MTREGYLKRATRGLWGRRRREVREELAAHIDERCLAYRLGGHSEEGALERALGELGAPAAISRGMVRVHVAPKAFTLSCVAALLLGAVAVLPKGEPPIVFGARYHLPTPACVTAAAAPDESCRSFVPWFSMAQLQETLTPLGAEFRAFAYGYELSLPQGRTIWLGLSQFRNLDPSLPAENQPLRDYIDLWTLIESLSRSDFEVRLEGLDNPRVHVGDLSFTLGTAEVPVEGRKLHSARLAGRLSTEIYHPTHERFFDRIAATYYAALGSYQATNPYRPYRFRVSDTPGTLYAVIVSTDTSVLDFGTRELHGDLIMHIDVAEVAPDGTVTLELPVPPDLSTRPSELLREYNKAVILRFSGRVGSDGLEYSIVTPDLVEP